MQEVRFALTNGYLLHVDRGWNRTTTYGLKSVALPLCYSVRIWLRGLDLHQRSQVYGTCEILLLHSAMLGYVTRCSSHRRAYSHSAVKQRHWRQGLDFHRRSLIANLAMNPRSLTSDVAELAWFRRPLSDLNQRLWGLIPLFLPLNYYATDGDVAASPIQNPIQSERRQYISDFLIVTHL